MLASLAPLYFLLFVCSIWPSISGRGAFEMFEKSWWRRSLIRGNIDSVMCNSMRLQTESEEIRPEQFTAHLIGHNSHWA
ncbi:hypothetical protein EDD15DRAFT_2300693 [Pisolithus albus]|nr:hypothetical protein EDD15DRAFT_2300693 [Pisolithus albus]